MDMASLPKYPEHPDRSEQPADVPCVSGSETDASVIWFLVGRLWANAGSLWRLFVLIISAGCYLLALGLPAAEGLLRTYSGVECLLSPIIETPFALFYPSWWANPVYMSGLFAFGLRKYGFAFSAGMVSVLFAAWHAVLVPNDSYHRQPYPGFWFWCAAMAVLTVGGLVSLIWSCSADSRGKATGSARTAAEPVTALSPVGG